MQPGEQPAESCEPKGKRAAHRALHNLDGSLRISGHSLRASGAQLLARLGFDMLSIQLLGRWGSDALLTYVRGAAVSVEAARARAKQITGSIRDLAGTATAAGVPPADARDFERVAREWFESWFPVAAEKVRPTLVDEAVEHLKRVIRPPTARRTSASSTSSSPSSTSSSSSPSAPAGPPLRS